MDDANFSAGIEDLVKELQSCSTAKFRIDIKEEDRAMMIDKLLKHERQMQDYGKLCSAEEYEVEIIRGEMYLFSIWNVDQFMPEVLNLEDIKRLRDIAYMLYKPKSVKISAAAFFRNPMGKGIAPHQDLIYEDRSKSERILSLNIDLVETNYKDGGLGYYDIHQGIVLQHRLCLKTGTFMLRPEEIKKLPRVDLHDSDKARLHTSFNVHKAKGMSRNGRRGIVLRLIAHCYGSTI